MLLWTFYLIAISLGCVWSLDENDTDDHWETFKDKYNKTYDSPEEEDEARDKFEANMLHVALHNMEDDEDFDKGLHQYSDMTEKEQIEALCGVDVPDNIDDQPVENFTISERALPSSWNWVEQGYVYPVKDQQSCGSCWSFSAAEAVESQWAISKNDKSNVNNIDQTLSEQQLVNCDTGNSGCNGGWPQTAFDYIKKNGLVKENCIPYVGKKNTCSIPRNCPKIKISSYSNVAADEQAVAQALYDHGPLTCAMYVSNNMMHYKSGVFTDSSYTNQGVNHGVLLVGYGTDSGQAYWLVKNSWGSSWGENGYIRIARNYNNHLKVASYTSYPIM